MGAEMSTQYVFVSIGSNTVSLVSGITDKALARKSRRSVRQQCSRRRRDSAKTLGL